VPFLSLFPPDVEPKGSFGRCLVVPVDQPPVQSPLCLSSTIDRNLLLCFPDCLRSWPFATPIFSRNPLSGKKGYFFGHRFCDYDISATKDGRPSLLSLHFLYFRFSAPVLSGIQGKPVPMARFALQRASQGLLFPVGFFMPCRQELFRPPTNISFLSLGLVFFFLFFFGGAANKYESGNFLSSKSQ